VTRHCGDRCDPARGFYTGVPRLHRAIIPACPSLKDSAKRAENTEDAPARRRRIDRLIVLAPARISRMILRAPAPQRLRRRQRGGRRGGEGKNKRRLGGGEGGRGKKRQRGARVARGVFDKPPVGPFCAAGIFYFIYRQSVFARPLGARGWDEEGGREGGKAPAVLDSRRPSSTDLLVSLISIPSVAIAPRRPEAKLLAGARGGGEEGPSRVSSRGRNSRRAQAAEREKTRG